MRGKGIYYVGRIIKLGMLNQEKLINALKKSSSISVRGNSWTLLDVKEIKFDSTHFVSGQLCKFRPKGEVVLVDENKKTEEKHFEPNLKIASSPFLYIPEHSGIVFLNISNEIEVETFRKRFCSIIEETYDKFMVECHIEMISDLRSFAKKIDLLDGIYEINARISPPNPLFGPLWSSLKKYLDERNTEKMHICEESSKNTPIVTDLKKHIKRASNQTINNPYKPEKELPIGDAAILMSADGYGSGIIKGKSADNLIIIKTSETVKNFSFFRKPVPSELYNKAKKIFENIESKRHMEH